MYLQNVWLKTPCRLPPGGWVGCSYQQEGWLAPTSRPMPSSPSSNPPWTLSPSSNPSTRSTSSSSSSPPSSPWTFHPGLTFQTHRRPPPEYESSHPPADEKILNLHDWINWKHIPIFNLCEITQITLLSIFAPFWSKDRFLFLALLLSICITMRLTRNPKTMQPTA